MNSDAVLRLLASPHNYEAAGRALFQVGTGAPTAADNKAWFYIDTDCTDETDLLYVYDKSGDAWNVVDEIGQ